MQIMNVYFYKIAKPGLIKTQIKTLFFLKIVLDFSGGLEYTGIMAQDLDLVIFGKNLTGFR